jgi:hypothetical protein
MFHLVAIYHGLNIHRILELGTLHACHTCSLAVALVYQRPLTKCHLGQKCDTDIVFGEPEMSLRMFQ